MKMNLFGEYERMCRSGFSRDEKHPEPISLFFDRTRDLRIVVEYETMDSGRSMLFKEVSEKTECESQFFC